MAGNCQPGKPGWFATGLPGRKFVKTGGCSKLNGTEWAESLGQTGGGLQPVDAV
mgnify:CR=1 FL=1